MYIVQIATECAPVAKVGGLADVVSGLSHELTIRGNAVEIILPKYDCMRYDQINSFCQIYNDLRVPWYNGTILCTIWSGYINELKCYFIDAHSKDQFFNRNRFYGCDDDPLRFAFFSRAALEFLHKSNRRPDIIHCHDWQTGLTPVLLYEHYKYHGMENQRICYTIHNFKHQGICSNEVLNATGLNRSEYYLGQKILSEHDSSSTVNFMKGGITYSNFVNTVSPHHAWESRFTDQGHGLGHTLHANQIKYGGILNGIDYSIWNPEIDSYIPAHYSVNSIHDKYKNKRALRDHFWLYHDSKPIIAFIGRLDGQKGLDLIHHTANYALHKGGQFVLLGVGSNNEIHDRFNNLKNQYYDNPHCHIELSFSEQLSHLIYAGADMIIVPSVFEPCGLTQLIALKYGTIPIARSVGGIVNTVFDRDHSDRPWWQRNGYTFNDLNFSGIESAINRAIGLYYDYPNDFRELMSSGMRQDYSWNLPGSNYVNIFDYIRHK